MAEDPDGEVLVPLLALGDVALHQHHGQGHRRNGLLQSSQAERAQAASSATPVARQRQPRMGTAASSSVARVSPCTPIHAAGWMNTSPTGPGISQTLPQGFQGNPVSTNCRARSASTHAPASARTRGQPRGAQRATQTGRGDEQRERRRERGHGERHQPPEARGLEQDRLGDPIESQHMVAEAEPPAAPRRHRGRTGRVQQDQQTWHRYQEDRDDVERRQCRRRKRAQAERGHIGTQAAQGRETRLQA